VTTPTAGELPEAIRFNCFRIDSIEHPTGREDAMCSRPDSFVWMI